MRYDPYPRRTAARWVLLATTLWTCAALAAPLLAQMQADSLFRDFEPIGEYQFELGGEVLAKAEIFQSRRAAAFLVLAPELSSPLLINPRTKSVESVHLMKVARQQDGSIDLLADATFGYLGTFRVAGTELDFDVKGKSARLRPKPPILGFQEAEALRSQKPEYDRLAAAYEPSSRHLGALKALDGEARVVIYFGTWCPTCSRLVPRVLRLSEELAGSKLDIDYYGLPNDMSDDPAAERDDIHGVPTGIVYAGGKEIARLSVKELNAPETALARILNGR